MRIAVTIEEKLQEYYKFVGADKCGNMRPGVKASKPDFLEMPKAIPIPPRLK